jgi:hypothetical protein
VPSPDNEDVMEPTVVIFIISILMIVVIAISWGRARR